MDNSSKLFELFVPTGKCNISKNIIIDDFRIISVDSFYKDLYVESKFLYYFTFPIKIKNKFKQENIRYFELIRNFCLKNNISRNIRLNSDKDFIIEIEFISYCHIPNICNKIIHENLNCLIMDIYNSYKSDTSYIINISENYNNYVFLYKLLKTNLFKKLNMKVDEFLYLFNIRNINLDNLDIKLSLVKTMDIHESNLLNISISGASDILDIKKDVVFIINNLDKYYKTIVEFFSRHDIESNNIISFRLKKLIDLRILNIYEFFKIELSVKNLIILSKLSKDNINKIIRVFKFIKSLNINNEDFINKSKNLNQIDINFFIEKLDNICIKNTSLEYQINFILYFKFFIKYKCDNL